MAVITASRHHSLLEALNNTIRIFEGRDHSELSSREIVMELKEKRILLEDIYMALISKTNQLKNLNEQYQQLQRIARGKLRSSQHNYSKL